MKIFNIVSAALVALVLVGCDGDARPFEEAVEVRTENLKSIAVVPPAITVPDLFMNIGESVQFGVQGTTVAGPTITLDASDRNWQVTNESVASISESGQLVAKADGEVGVFLSIGGLRAETYYLEVADHLLTGVQEIIGDSRIERCLPGNYQATGLFGDGTVRDLSGVNWTLTPEETTDARLLNNPDTTATLTGLNTGAVTLTAALSGFSLPLPIEIADSLRTLSISPTSGSVAVGGVTTFVAFGEFADEVPDADATDTTATLRTENVTASVDWAIASGATYASVTNSADSRGEVTGLASGGATLLASCGTLSSLPVVLTVTASSTNDSDNLSFLRDSVTLVVGNSTTLSVSTGSRYSSANKVDNDDLTWELSSDDTSNPAISLSVDGTNAGRIEARAVGGATITVSDGNGASGSIRVEVISN